MQKKVVDIECSNCVFYDSGICLKYNDEVDQDYFCDDYEQEELEPTKVKNHKKPQKKTIKEDCE